MGCSRESHRPEMITNAPGQIARDLATQVAQIERREEQINQTIWAKEMLAQEEKRVDSGGKLPHVSGAKKKFVAGHLGVCRRFTQGRDK